MTRPAESLLRQIAHAMQRHAPDLAPSMEPGGPPRAAVALVVRPRGPDLELLLIKRATAAGDPWSGHMAFPGGRESPSDASLLETARRETLEEVGIDLASRGRLLGRLSDVRPLSSAPRIQVSAFAFAVEAGAEPHLNHEVDLAVWVPLRNLAEPGAATEYIHALASGESLRFPAIGYQEHVVWGLTYRIMSQFLEIALSGAEQGGVR